MKKPFAWVSQGALGISFARPWGSSLPSSRLNDRKLGLVLVVQRSGKVRGLAGCAVCPQGFLDARSVLPSTFSLGYYTALSPAK